MRWPLLQNLAWEALKDLEALVGRADAAVHAARDGGPHPDVFRALDVSENGARLDVAERVLSMLLPPETLVAQSGGAPAASRRLTKPDVGKAVDLACELIVLAWANRGLPCTWADDGTDIHVDGRDLSFEVKRDIEDANDRVGLAPLRERYGDEAAIAVQWSGRYAPPGETVGPVRGALKEQLAAKLKDGPVPLPGQDVLVNIGVGVIRVSKEPIVTTRFWDPIEGWGVVADRVRHHALHKARHKTPFVLVYVSMAGSDMQFYQERLLAAWGELASDPEVPDLLRGFVALHVDEQGVAAFGCHRPGDTEVKHVFGVLGVKEAPERPGGIRAADLWPMVAKEMAAVRDQGRVPAERRDEWDGLLRRAEAHRAQDPDAAQTWTHARLLAADLGEKVPVLHAYDAYAPPSPNEVPAAVAEDHVFEPFRQTIRALRGPTRAP